MLHLEVIESGTMVTDVRDEIRALCVAAYNEAVLDLPDTLGAATHVLGRLDSVLVSHGMWVTRWLQPGVTPPLMTAYVEWVATLPSAQGKGYATRVMQRLATAIPAAFQLAALSPATDGLYERLGWRFWRGPLSIRMPSGSVVATPDERVMVLELPGRQRLPLDGPLSAEWREGELW